MIKTSIVADSIKLSLVRSLFNEAKKYDDVIDFAGHCPHSCIVFSNHFKFLNLMTVLFFSFSLKAEMRSTILSE